VVVCAAVLALAGCGSTPRGGGPRGGPLLPERGDGVGPRPPANLDQVPDAVPRIERIPPGGPNRPYEVFGRSYTPITNDRPFSQLGLASWYGAKFHGRRTANGEIYNMYAMTAAHPTLPLPSYVRVRNPANDREVILRVNDRGPFHPGRIIDLSYAAALKLGLLRGVGIVELERITPQEIRSGEWRRGGGAAPPPSLPAPTQPPPAQEKPVSSATPPEPVADSVPVVAAEAVAAAPSLEAPATPASAAAPGFWVQLGAFRDAEGAAGFRDRVEAEVEWLGPRLAIANERSLHRLQAGPYASRDEAQAAAQRVRDALHLVPVVVERR
jgi:rare lipoprotein A